MGSFMLAFVQSELSESIFDQSTCLPKLPLEFLALIAAAFPMVRGRRQELKSSEEKKAARQEAQRKYYKRR